jgi:glycosyltransferase involved in cell wall biosynthesis
MAIVEDKKKPLVSIIVNCYNGEQFLKNCFRSIIDQTYTNWELIFWDNASTDKSAEIYSAYKDSRFKYFKSKVNVTLGQARAWAVNQCTGEYIAFLDVDDEWLPEKTELQIEKMIKDDAVLCYGGIIEVYQHNRKTKVILPKYLSKNNFKNNLLQFEIPMPTIVLKRSALIRKGLNFDSNITASEEYCLSMQLIYNEKVSVINVPLSKYLVRNNSLTLKNSSHWATERIYTLKKLINSNPELNKIYKTELSEAFSRSNYYIARHFMILKKRKKAKRELSKIKFNNFKYFSLYILAHFPIFFWNKIHFIKNKRG